MKRPSLAFGLVVFLTALLFFFMGNSPLVLLSLIAVAVLLFYFLTKNNKIKNLLIIPTVVISILISVASLHFNNFLIYEKAIKFESDSSDIVATVVEYVVHYVYEEILGVSIWDYSDVPYNVNGRICLTFTFFWFILSGILVYWIHPYIEKNLTSIPKSLFLTVLIFVGIDAIISVFLYKKFGNKNAVNINWLITNFRHKIG